MTDENCPNLKGLQGLTSGTWMVTDSGDIICLETGVGLRMLSSNQEIVADVPNGAPFITLWSFETTEACEKKFDWLKTILMGEMPTSPIKTI